MTARPQVAVFLAAGRGVRLGARGRERPKGLLEINGEALMARSLRLLAARGVRRFVLVTGHLEEQYAERFGGRDDVELRTNEAYATTESLASAAIGLRDLDEPVWLLESDILFEGRGLDAVTDHPAPDVILASGRSGAGDEVWLDAPGGQLRAMSKDARSLASVDGEFVGVCRLSGALARSLCEAYEAFVEDHGHGRVPYEEWGLVRCAARRSIAVCRIDDLAWGEIDDEAQRARVLADVAPRLDG